MTELNSNDVDLQLVEKSQAGDLNAFNEIVERHQRVVFNTCYRMLRDAQLAEDATQDAFLRAWSAIDSFRGGLVRPWLLRIATNRVYDVLRAQSRRPAQSLDAQPYESLPEWQELTAFTEHPEQYSTRAESSALLESMLHTLPYDQRIAITLSDVQGYPYDEIAEITGVSVGTIKSRISRGRAKLRTYLRSSPELRELVERFNRSD